MSVPLWCAAVIDSSSSLPYNKEFCNIVFKLPSLWLCGCICVRVREHSGGGGLRVFIYCDVLARCLGSEQTVITGHHSDKGETAMINDCPFSPLFSLPFPWVPSPVSTCVFLASLPPPIPTTPHLSEDLDDLRMEGVTGLAPSGSKFSQGRSSYQPEPQAKVTLNICSRCAR